MRQRLLLALTLASFTANSETIRGRVVTDDGMPLVEVDLRPGREPERKKALVGAIAEILNDTMGVEAADVYVLFRENPAENHYCGGTPLAPWVPTDK